MPEAVQLLSTLRAFTSEHDMSPVWGPHCAFHKSVCGLIRGSIAAAWTTTVAAARLLKQLGCGVTVGGSVGVSGCGWVCVCSCPVVITDNMISGAPPGFQSSKILPQNCAITRTSLAHA